MGITKLRANTQILPGTVDSTTVKDNALIPKDFAVWPLVPENMSTAQRNLITNPTTGLMIFNVDNAVLEVYNGAEWSAVIDTGTLIDKLTVTDSGELILDDNGNIVSTL